MKGHRVAGSSVLTVLAALELVCGLAIHVRAQQPDLAKPTVPIVSVVGCASRGADVESWMLMRATEGTASATAFTTKKELESARSTALGTSRYRLIGTAEFLSPDELLRQTERAAFTRKDTANATGQLQNGHKLLVKGLLIVAGDEKRPSTSSGRGESVEPRLNLLSVQRLSDTCQ